MVNELINQNGEFPEANTRFHPSAQNSVEKADNFKTISDQINLPPIGDGRSPQKMWVEDVEAIEDV